MQASKVAGVYVVEELEVVRRRYRGRPMSERMAWAFMEFLSWADPRLDNATERARLRRYWTDLKAHSDPASLLATWLRRRAERLECQAQLGSIEDLRQDPRVVLSGVSDPRSGLSAEHQVEAYVQPSHLDAVVKDHLLVPAVVPNVFLHVTDRHVSSPMPLGLVLTDLADHGGPREDAQVEQILKRILYC